MDTYQTKTRRMQGATIRSAKAAQRAAQTARIAAAKAQAARVLESGVCPMCGTRLRRNLAITGWYQCGAFGEPTFRETPYAALPKCDFQMFTE